MPIDLSCSACGRKLTSPKWFQGSAYGSDCFREVAGEALRRGRRAAGMGRIGRRGERPLRRGEMPAEADPNQLPLQLEEVTQ